MTDPILRLDPERLSVEPGGQVTLSLTVTNPGTIVDGYSVDVVSTMPLPWVQVNPSTLSVYPQQEATAVITFSPPSGPGAPSGSLPFGVRVWSEAQGGGSAVAEGDLDIGSVSGLQAKLTPIASTGRWSGRHTLRVSNWGNAPARLRIVPEDPAQALGFLASPEVLDIPLGGEATARIKVRTRHPALRGSLQRLPFTLACEPDAPAGAGGPVPLMSTTDRPVVDGAFNQKPILTRMVVVVAGLALLAGIGAVAWAVTRDEPAATADAGTNPPRPTGFQAIENQSPEKVQLVWDEMDGVDGFKIFPHDPDTGEQESALDVEGGSTTTANAILEPDTYMCFSLAAVRGGLESKPTKVVETSCGQTEPAATEEVPPVGVPSPSVAVTPAPAGGDDEEDGGEPPSTVDPDAPPGAFISVLDSASSDPTGEVFVRAAQQQYAAAGAAAKVLLATPFDLARVDPEVSPPAGSPPLAEPVELWLVYVDGATAAEAFEACGAALAEATDGAALAITDCTTFQVVSSP